MKVPKSLYYVSMGTFSIHIFYDFPKECSYKTNMKSDS